MSEVKSSIDMSFTSCGEEVRDEQKGVTVLLGNFVKASIVNAESE